MSNIPQDVTQSSLEPQVGSSSSVIPDSVKLFETWPGADNEIVIGKNVRDRITSPNRISGPETFQRFQEKQAKAQEARERFLEEKVLRSKEKVKKVENIKAWKEEQQQQLLADLNSKLQKAEELRQQQIIKIKRTAHDEDVKVSEIHFINEIEAQLKRHEILIKEKDSEARRQDLQEERQRKRKEENAAKEAAAEDRKKALEAEHQAKIVSIKEKIKEKDKKLERQLFEKGKERIEQATQKQKTRELKLSAISAAQQANVEELQRKIQLKQEASEKRKQENMDQIRQKAFELSVRRCSEFASEEDAPRSVPYETQKMCSVCKVLIGSEIYLYSHLRGKRHQDAIRTAHEGKSLSCEELELYNLKHIVDAPDGTSANDLNPELAIKDKERLKQIKKRCSKLRQRMASQSTNFEQTFKEQMTSATANSGNKSKIIKCKKELETIAANIFSPSSSSSSSSPTSHFHSLDRSVKNLEKLVSSSPLLLVTTGAIDPLVLILKQSTSRGNNSGSSNNRGVSEVAGALPDKSFCNICHLIEITCLASPQVTLYIFNSNVVGVLLDFLEYRLTTLLSSATSLQRKLDVPAGSVGRCLSAVFDTLLKSVNLQENAKDAEGDQRQRALDVISYSVSVGIVDKLSLCMVNAQGPVDSEVAFFLISTLLFLTSLTALLIRSRCPDTLLDTKRPQDDPTQLAITLQMTQIAGVVPLTYGILLHSQVSCKYQSGNSVPDEASKYTLAVAEVSISLLNHVALVDLQMLQNTLGSEGLSLQVRHITRYILSYCKHWPENRSLMHQVILLVGYFCVMNPENQAVIQSGQSPTILQQLCSLPFEYFSDPGLVAILFPSLVSCCFPSKERMSVLEQEMSPSMLASFIESATESSIRHSSLLSEEKWSLALRFPRNQWSKARTFFTESS